MSVAGISSTNALTQPSFFASFQQRRNDFQELSQALQSGDLASAQTAFTDLSNLNQNSPLAQRFANSQAGKDFAAIGQALQSGDLDGAQQAFATFQQDVKAAFQQRFQPQPTQHAQQTQAADQQPSVHHHHNHHHHHAANGKDENSSSNGDSISITDANGDKITINLGATSHSSDGGPEQVTLNFGSGSGPQQVTLNLNGNDNITLNFGTTNSTPATTQSTGSQLNVTA